MISRMVLCSNVESRTSATQPSWRLMTGLFRMKNQTRWKIFFDIERFPGKRALKSEPKAILEWVMLSYNVPVTQIYDLLSTERGLKLVTPAPESIEGEHCLVGIRTRAGRIASRRAGGDGLRVQWPFL